MAGSTAVAVSSTNTSSAPHGDFRPAVIKTAAMAGGNWGHRAPVVASDILSNP
jgi:hypothetical protein